MPVFESRSTLPHPPEEVFAWHERPGAFERLTPPWADVQVLEREGGIRDGARVLLRVRKGPVDVKWELRHRDYEENRLFRDEQVRGPLRKWVHSHRFEPDGEGGTLLVDEVEWEPPLGSAGDLFAKPAVDYELKRLFAFRHRRLANDLALHGRFADRPRMAVAVSGATGLIGSHLRHFLTTGGHRVLPLVRAESRKGEEGIRWSWRDGEVDRAALEKTDAVVHLAGEPVIGLRWTDEKKREIWDSRVKGTELLARTMAELHSGPGTLVSASGMHYYGSRGDEILTEDSSRGKGFLADVCRAWEEATSRADRSGVRVVRIRTGFVLSAEGGALGTMLLPFKLGLGGRLGSGKHFVPWIDLDDEIGAIHHALMTPDLRGPVNACAPNPVPQATFSDALGRVLSRPTVIPVPALAVKTLFGEMGRELLLEGQRARPARLTASGYDFLFQGVEESLRFQLGRFGSDADGD
jgi:uncharacterized protein (TIGR01777 family)